MEIWVVYESNYGDLILDGCNATTLVNVFTNENEALECKLERIEIGEEQGYVRDLECEDYKDLLRTLIMFKNEQENWDDYYEICVEKFKI